MGREGKQHIRRSGFRDSKAFIIATEGIKTEIKYFNDLKSSEYFNNTKVHLHVIKRENTNSSPEYILKILENFQKKYRFDSEDEMWIIIDRDKQSWTPKTIKNIAQKCKQKNIRIGLSNPCFELWLLLHLKDIDDYSQEKKKQIFENKKISSNKNARTQLNYELFSILNSYNSANIDTAKFLSNVELAIERAKKIDKYPTHRWPNYLATRVYRLVEGLIKPL